MPSLRILYSSNAFWAPSGYGVQGRSLLPRLAELPEISGRENIAQFAWYGLQGGIHEVDGFRVYPVARDAYGNDVLGMHMQDFRANLLISLIDVWVMHDTRKKIGPALWAPWLPIDHDPVPQSVLDSLDGADMPVTYSKWGHELLTKTGVTNRYVPHGIEPDVFKVIQNEHIDNMRMGLLGGNADGHLTIMVAANKGFPDRKAFQVQLRAWAEFAKDKPHARIYIHTEPTTMWGGVDFAELIKRLDIQDRVLFPNRYQYFKGLPANQLAAMYNCADVFLGASMAEGFGIPIIEAQACGLPVIVGNYSSMPELVRWGHSIDAADIVWTPMNSWQWWPDVKGIQNALEDLYAKQRSYDGEWPLEWREEVSKLIHDEFNWDAIVRDQWAPLIAELADIAPDFMEMPQSPEQIARQRIVIGQNGDGPHEPVPETV